MARSRATGYGPVGARSRATGVARLREVNAESPVSTEVTESKKTL